MLCSLFSITGLVAIVVGTGPEIAFHIIGNLADSLWFGRTQFHALVKIGNRSQSLQNTPNPFSPVIRDNVDPFDHTLGP